MSGAGRGSRIVRTLLVLLALLATALIAALIVALRWPRPLDTTAASVYAPSDVEIDYCAPPPLDGDGLRADDIPRAYSPPSCRWEAFPQPVLADCREPLAPDAVDLRGLWRVVAGGRPGHLERIEQCGNRVVITTSGILHDFRTDGTLARGANDVNPDCMRIYAAIDWREGVLHFEPFGLPITIVTRRLENDELIWTYPGFGTNRMQRVCRLTELEEG